MSFLIVGHTHEDIDSRFSMISRTLRAKDAEVFDDLLKILQSAERVTKIFDVKKWLGPNLNTVQDITQPFHYKFVNVEGIVKIMYKGLQHQPWILLEGDFLQEIPDGVPEIVNPDYSKIEIEKKVENIEAIRLLLKRDSYKTWTDFYKTLMSTDDSSVFPLTLLPKQPIVPPIPLGCGLVPEVRELIEKENRRPLVGI